MLINDQKHAKIGLKGDSIMNKEDKVKALLTSRYETVVKAHFEALDTWKAKRQLYTKINTHIDKHLKDALAQHQDNETTMQTFYKQAKQKVKKVLQTHLKDILEERETQAIIKNNQEQAVLNTFESKDATHNLKAQKINANFDYAVKEATKTLQNTENESDQAIEDAIADHNKHMETLLAETNALYEDIAPIETKAHETFDEHHQKVEQERDTQLKQVDKTIKTYIKEAKEGLKSLKTAYKKECEPIDQDIKQLKADHEANIKALESEYQAQKNKLENYKKEAEKINDTSQTNQYEKQLKALKKGHQSTLKEKRIEHEQMLSPEYDKRKEKEKAYTNKVETFKHNTIDKLTEYLNDIERTHHESQIALEEGNTELNLTLAKYKHKKNAINIDYEIQNINYDHTLNEKKAIAEHEKAIAKPYRDQTENDARLQRDSENTELKTLQGIAEAKKKRDLDKNNAQADYEEATLDILERRMQYLYEFDIDNLDHHKHATIIERDLKAQKVLSDHYTHHSKNYAALSSEHLDAYHPYIKKDINNRLNLQLEMYKNMLQTVENNHKNIIKDIETAFEQEAKLYQQPLESLKAEHEQTLSELKAKHDQELNGLEKQLEKATNKKQKEGLRKDLRNLKEKLSAQLEETARKLEKKRFIYSDMLQTITENKAQSIEEAETLLYHSTDQINLAMDEANQQARDELDEFESRSLEIKKRSGLFYTFQGNRKKDTIQSADDYAQTRHQRLENLKQKNKDTLEAHLINTDKEQEKIKSSLKDKLYHINATYDKTVAQLEKTKEERMQQHLDDHGEETNRLTLYKNKLKRNHDNTMRNLKEQSENKRQERFNDKDRNDATYENTVARLNKELLDFKSDKAEALEKTKKFYQNNANKLKDHVTLDALKHLDAPSFNTITAIIKAEEPVPE